MAQLSAQEVMCLLELMTSSSDSDDDIILTCERREKFKGPNFVETVDQLTEEEFRSHFRLERRTAASIIQRYKASPFYPSDRTHGGTPPMSAEHDVLSFLWFAGNKVSLRDVASRFGVGLSTTFYQISRTMDFLLDIAPSIIRFPEDKQQAARNFVNIAQFPDTLGCIDGTSIPIRTPAHRIKSTYVNRHDIPSITLQAVCDSQKKFIDVSVGAPSKIHDARVFQFSDLSFELPEICENRYHVLGDSAYAIREWLLVPYRHYGNLTRGQKLYNKRFCATRVLIENSFGILKGRFRQLLEVHMHDVDKITKFIISCCVLHNFCIEYDDQYVCYHEVEDMEYEELENEADQYLKRRGEEKRAALTRQFEDDED